MSKRKQLWCTLSLGAVVIKCYLVPTRSKHLGRGKLHGFFDSGSGSIYIDQSQPDSMAEMTLIHELGHAVIFASGGHLAPEGRPHTDDEEEVAVDAIANGLYSALKQNGMLLLPPRPEVK